MRGGVVLLGEIWVLDALGIFTFFDEVPEVFRVTEFFIFSDG